MLLEICVGGEGGGGGRLHEFICIRSVIPVLILVCTMNMGFDQFRSCQGTEFADLLLCLAYLRPLVAIQLPVDVPVGKEELESNYKVGENLMQWQNKQWLNQR